MSFPHTRLRRLRQHPQLRRLVSETTLSTDDLIYPLFITHGSNIKNPIKAMPGLYQWSVDRLAEELDQIQTLKIPAVLLFGLPENKDPIGSHSYNENGVVQQATQFIKNNYPEIMVIADVCLCEYTDHGHCGIMNEVSGKMDLDNDTTLELLQKQAISFAAAGVDMIAPSGMIDGMVQAIRSGLDQENFTHIPIMSYAVKYASSFYGPFRHAADCAPQFGDRKTYQMDPANITEAVREAELDITEGADMIMVKPAMPYLDVIQKLKTNFPQIPLSAYQVSGEYAMLQAAIEKNMLDERAIFESVISIKRAGADCIITYFAKQIAQMLQTS